MLVPKVFNTATYFYWKFIEVRFLVGDALLSGEAAVWLVSAA